MTQEEIKEELHERFDKAMSRISWGDDLYSEYFAKSHRPNEYDIYNSVYEKVARIEFKIIMEGEK